MARSGNVVEAKGYARVTAVGDWPADADGEENTRLSAGTVLAPITGESQAMLWIVVASSMSKDAALLDSGRGQCTN
jgi:hypothetical protein